MASSTSHKYLLGMPVDPDLAEQAVPGHGVPSQDPGPATQYQMSEKESARESRSTLVTGCMIFGIIVGAGLCAAVAGLMGVFIGGAAGGVIGAGIATCLPMD